MPDVFEAPTAVNNAFTTEAPTVQQASPFGFEAPTATQIGPLPKDFPAMPTVVVASMTPPIGMALMRQPMPMQYPVGQSPYQQDDYQPVDLTPKNQWIWIGGICGAVLLLLIIISAAAC